jgi:hypothetical protein
MTICEIHEEIGLILERQEDISAKSYFALLKLLTKANNCAWNMESGLHLRKMIMDKHGIEEEYQKRKIEMREAGFLI